MLRLGFSESKNAWQTTNVIKHWVLYHINTFSVRLDKTSFFSSIMGGNGHGGPGSCK